jgi:PAS domain S-box-containing protein
MGQTAMKQLKSVDEETLNSLPIAVILFDNDQIYFLNNKARDIFEIPHSELKNLHKFSIFHLLDKKLHPLVKRNNNLILGGQELFAAEREFVNFNNKNIVIEASSNAVMYRNKKVIQTLFYEVSERRQKRRESEAARDVLKKISESSLDVIFHFSFFPIQVLKFISDSSKHVLGFSQDEIFKNPDIIRKRVEEKDRHLVIFTREEYKKAAGAHSEKKHVLRYHHPKGDMKFLEIVVNPVWGENKDLVGIIGDMRDVTARTMAEDQLVEAKRKFDLITNNGNDIIAFYSYHPEEKYLYISPNISKILGFDGKQLLNDSRFFEKRLLSSKEEFSKSDKFLRTLQKRNSIRSHCFSFKILNNENEEVWLENNLVPITDGKGKISFFINIIRNITEQKEAEIEIENQYINYRNLLDNSPVAYVIHDHGVCLYVNKALMKLFGIKSKNEIIGKFGLDFFEPADRKKAVERIMTIYRSKDTENKTFIYNVRDLVGNQIEVEFKSVLIKFNNKDCILSLVTNLSELRKRENEKLKMMVTEMTNKRLKKEIKERQEAEKNLTEKTAHLSSILESSTHLIWTVNSNYEVTSFNRNFYNVVRMQHGVNVKPGNKIDERLKKNKKEYVDFWYPRYQEAFSGHKLEFEKKDWNEGRSVYRKIFINPIVDETGKINEISCIANDITDSKIYEHKLLSQTGKLTAIFDSSHHYIWTIDNHGKLTSFNKNYYDLVTALYNTKPYVGLVLDRGVLANDHEYNTVLKYHYDKAFAGSATSFEIETRDKDKKKIYLEIFFNPIFENKEVVEVSGIAHNITEKKHVQQRMELSLKEKEILLREVHHRVKNNMQVISSILNLQSAYVSDENTLTLLRESQNRIKTMAYIHESLYQNKSFSSVNFSDYVRTLVNNIVLSYSYTSEKISLALDMSDIDLSLDLSIPAGLIINELITNAMKHAFPGEKHGIITLKLRNNNGKVTLHLIDNGVGFAPGVDFRNSHSLGLQLVNTLAEQIEAEVDFKSQKDCGTEVFLSFKA